MHLHWALMLPKVSWISLGWTGNRFKLETSKYDPWEKILEERADEVKLFLVLEATCKPEAVSLPYISWKADTIPSILWGTAWTGLSVFSFWMVLSNLMYWVKETSLVCCSTRFQCTESSFSKSRWQLLGSTPVQMSFSQCYLLFLRSAAIIKFCCLDEGIVKWYFLVRE